MWQLFREFVDPTAKPDSVVLAQVEAFKKRLPMLHVILAINTAALAFTHLDTAPPLLSIYIPGAFVILMVLRLFQWRRTGDVSFTPAEARKTLTATVVMMAVMSCALLAWAIALYKYDTASAPGTLTATGHVALFAGISLFSSSLLVMHVRAAALLIPAACNIIFCGYLLSTGAVIESVVAGNLILVSGVLFYVLRTFANDFEEMVASKANLRRMSSQNAELANTDPATGLPNRRCFFNKLESLNAATAPYAVALLDLDGFKQINDLYGHVAGDKVLHEVSQRLLANVPEGACVARTGGDEFAILLPSHCAGKTDVMVLCDHLIMLCKTPIILPHMVANVGVSIGVSISTNAEIASSAHYERADYALYHVKKHRRGHVELFSPEHEQTIRQSSKVEQVLRGADLDQEIDVWCQPIVRASDKKIVSFEALSRWNSPTLGLVSPEIFIPVAERSDLIHLVTRTALRKALAHATAWPGSIDLKINLSTRDVTSSEQVLHLLSILRQSKIAPSRVTFEITETLLADDLTSVQASIALFKMMGVSVAVDDFGAGYSSLSYIHQLAPDAIKIDKKFTDGFGVDHTATSIVKTIVELCRNIGARSIMEGVESQAQADLLCEIGCDELQGYLFSQPLAAADVLPFLEQEEQRSANIKAARLSA